MNKAVIIAALSLFSALTFAGEAETQSTALGVSQSQSQGTVTESSSGASNTGVNQNITFTSPPQTTATVVYSGTQTVKTVPNVSGPQLATGGNDVCMGSSSGSLNWAGFGGGFGSTWTDKHCEMLKSTAMFANLGQGKTAIARMCEDPINKRVLELTGYECPQTTHERKQAESASTNAVHPELTDPIARKRMGYPPL